MGPDSMCGRFTLTAPRADIARFLAAELPEGEEPAPRWNIAPTQDVLAAVQDGPARRLQDLHWGLVASWAKDRSMAGRMINARAETVAAKPAFRAAFRARRCLVPMSGFYEWKREGGLKLPFHFCRSGGGLLAAAGLWESWTDPDGLVLRSALLLTTEANDLMRPVHHRMPVLLDRAGREAWMDPAATPTGLQALLVPAAAGRLERWRVSRAVNRASFDQPSCVEPAAPEGLFEDPPT